MFVRHADEATASAAVGTTAPRSAYLDHEALERALRAARADAAWVGWGFVAEQPEFAELCERLGIVFVGPDAATSCAGSATRSRPSGWPRRPACRSRRGAAARSRPSRRRSATPRAIGFPLMIKAAAGGGGRGIRRVDGRASSPAAFARARAEAAAGVRRRHACCWSGSSAPRATSRCR